MVWFGSPGAASVEEFPSLVGLRDGSWASTKVVDGHVRVAQYGDRRLWDIFENAYRQWTRLGRPPRTRYGISVTPDRQWVWLDDPAGPHQWSLTNKVCSAIPTATPSAGHMPRVTFLLFIGEADEGSPVKAERVIA